MTKLYPKNIFRDKSLLYFTKFPGIFVQKFVWILWLKKYIQYFLGFVTKSPQELYVGFLNFQSASGESRSTIKQLLLGKKRLYHNNLTKTVKKATLGNGFFFFENKPDMFIHMLYFPFFTVYSSMYV